jgi:predicted glutamine amidotransferase
VCPVQWGMYMFMHNGVIANFMRIRRTLLATLSEQVSMHVILGLMSLSRRRHFYAGWHIDMTLLL